MSDSLKRIMEKSMTSYANRAYDWIFTEADN